MRPDALRVALTAGNVDQRVGLLRGLTDPEILDLIPSLFAVLITDSSLQVRRAAEEALARRPAHMVQEHPAPLGSMTKEKVNAVAAEFVHEPGFVGVLLGSEPGRNLLTRLPLDRLPLDNALLDVAHTIDTALLPKMLALPLDLSGRACRLIERFPEYERLRREGITHALVWSALRGAGMTPLQADTERAKQSFTLWIEGLVASLSTGVQPPTYAEFVAAGARLTSGPVEQQAEAPSAEAIDALATLGRIANLAIVGTRSTLLDRSSVEGALASGHADLEVIGWSLLARNGLTSPEEILGLALGEARPGVIVELLHLLGVLPPELAGDLCTLLTHPRASVRLATTQVLARSPLSAAIASATFDPRAEDTPLNVLAAQPEFLADPALIAYLDTPRSPRLTARALGSIHRPPAPTWARWQELLSNSAPRVREAARVALLRLPLSEAPGVAAFLPRLFADAPLDAVRVIERFRLADHRAELADLLVDTQVAEDVALATIRVLRSYGDAQAWETLWRFVSGDPPKRRYGTRRSRAAALEALLVVPPPRPTPPRRSAEPRSQLARLLTDRDPSSVELALRYLGHHPSAVTSELLDSVYDLLLATLAQARRTRAQRSWRAGWRRLLRAFLPRSWVAPRASPRGRQARLLTRLLEATVDLEVRGIWADEIAPALDHAAPAVRRAAVRLTLRLRRGSLESLVDTLSQETAREAIVAAQRSAAEALVGARLSRACRGDLRALTQVRGWLAARPLPSALPYLERLLRAPAAREDVVASLVAIHAVPEGAAPVAAIAAREAAQAVASGESDQLAPAADLLERLSMWTTVPRLLPALAWASESARKRLVELVRRARAEHVPLNAADLSPLLEHPLSEVRVLALSLLRSVGPTNLWEAVRPHGPGWSRPLPTNLAKPFLGVCEDHYEESMGLTVESLLPHPNGEVARRAVKLINRREREIASLALFQALDDPELRQPILTTFSTWSARFVEPGLSSELLEEARRTIRSAIAALVEGQHVTQVRDAARAALGDSEGDAPQGLPYLHAAALFAVGRLTLSELDPAVTRALESGDPMLQRCAAWAAGELPAKTGAPAPVDRALTALVRAREPELRVAARVALVKRIDPEQAGALEGLLTDPSAEVRLRVLAALRARPEALASVTLEARLGDPDPRMREQVLLALADRRAGNAAALRGALADPQPEVRLAALAVVAAWSALNEVRHEVGERLADPSIHVSGAALELLGDVDPAVELEPEDDSESEPNGTTESGGVQ